MLYIKEYDNYSSYKGFKDNYNKRKEDFIKSLKNFSDLTDEKIQECVDYFGYEGYNNEDDAYEDLKEKVSEWQKFTNPVKLYRVVGAESEDSINKEELGEHWTPYDWNLDGDLLGSIGDDLWEDEYEAYVIEALVPHSEIDLPQTIIQNLSFPNEHEINLKNKGKGAKFVKAYKLD